ncbi:hypothetical protein PMAC_000731 [Pneumocystis sp. 'macacae']|nr:hypothetical protein PMAC_000731 [Pneumocystis sp. 'macacae']
MASLANASFKDVLDDLSVRFIVNLPEEELISVARICFQIEQAHWYYEDFIRELNPQLPSMHLRTFCLTLFGHCPLLWKWKKDQEKAYSDFLKYKIRVPVRGAIILNDACDECVLVKGWRNSSGWGFPKGKINKGERDSDCAIREVYEETGFDISGLLRPKDYIEITLREQNIRLYIVTNVSKDTNFETRTRKEIRKIKWHKLANLPAYFVSKKKNDCKDNQESMHKYYLVAPFLEPLLKWIRKKRKVYLNSAETTEESIISSLETNQHALKKNSETFKTLLEISCPHVDTASFDIPSDFEPSIKERFTFINDNRNISDDEQYNTKYNKNNLPRALNKELEEERIKGAERILELLRSNINLNINKESEEENIASKQINNINFFKHEVEKNEYHLSLHSNTLHSPENIKRCKQVSSTLNRNTVLDNNDKNNLNEETLLLTLLGKQKRHDLEKNDLSQENLDIKNNRMEITKSMSADRRPEYLYKSKKFKNYRSPSSLKASTSHSSLVTHIGGTAIEELDAQLLLYLENVVTNAEMQN